MAPIMPQASLIAQDLNIVKNWEVEYETLSWPSLCFCSKSFDISNIIVS